MDKMPDDLYVRRVGKKKFSAVPEESPLALGGFVAFAEARPPKPRIKYTRADLPKEVDLGALKKNKPYTKSLSCTCDQCKSWDASLDHLVALGVIKDKGV